jgi:endogenous inhibitor of DNA gyrase (YacG/DUF329 family)
MTKARPICAMCGKPYGTRKTTEESFVWKKGEPIPSYRGNKIVSKETIIRKAGHNSTGKWKGVPFGPDDNVAQRYLWDGESYYTKYKPFCTLRCALDYARRAHQAHLLNTEEES